MSPSHGVLGCTGVYWGHLTSLEHFIVIHCFAPPGLGVSHGSPELKNEVVSEPESLQIRIINGLCQLHRVGLPVSEVPDLRG